ITAGVGLCRSERFFNLLGCAPAKKITCTHGQSRYPAVTTASKESSWITTLNTKTLKGEHIMRLLKKSLISVAAALAATVAAAPAMADYPNKPINVIVPWGAGGDSDLTTRLWADAVEESLGN